MANNSGGYIHERPDKRWNVHYRGRATTCKNKTAAQAKLREWKQECQKDKINIGKLTVKDVIEDWLEGVVKSNLKPTSYDRKRMVCEKQVYPYLGNMQVSAIKPKDVENMLLGLYNSGLSHSTIKKSFEAINGCMKYLVAKQEIPYNPIVGVTVPTGNKKESSEIVFYTEDELEVIYNESTRKFKNGKNIYRQGYAIMLLANTGIRLGELLGLTWEDVDLDRNILSVNKNRVKVKVREESTGRKNKMILQDGGKTRNSVREVPLNKKAVTALNNLKQINGSFDYVMSTKNGVPSDQKNIDRMFRNILAACKFPEDKIYGVHSLRHSFATSLIRKGVNVKIVSEILGHSDVSITLKTYTHFIPKDYSDAVAVLDY